MTQPKPSFTESERDEALQRYDILDTPPEEEFDDLARIAAEVCGTPIAVVNLLDSRRQFFKAEVGLGIRGTPLETSFCVHALLVEDFLVVPDATKDARFDGNPLVHEDPKLRFYAGALLKTRDGVPIGTMCVLDHKPRELDENQIRTLRLLARQAMTQLELRRSLAATRQALREAKEMETRHRQIVDSAVDFGIITLDLEGRVTSWSVGAEAILGWTEAEMIGRLADVFFTEEDQAADVPDKEMRAARERGRGSDERWHRRRDGSQFWASGEMMPLRDDDDRHLGYVKILRDRTLQHQAEAQRQELTREMSHRMKNSFAMVQSIVAQSLRTAPSVAAARDAIGTRIEALARAQDILTQTSGTHAAIGDVVRDALAPHRTGEGRFDIVGPALELTAQQVVGLSLALHELATNAVKHGALSQPGGGVAIAWEHAADDGFTFDWREHGGPAVTAPTRTGFGTRLIERIVGPYFDGTATLGFEPDGVRFRLVGQVGQAVNLPDEAAG
ncbi:sensor histidine kinase [Aurantimonas sp. HBX-1]|uniref:sensor histidine kinase n=1 Tax=Aurantimonas sp. HBX-1 TaxID=2906072 RepID=UPI001F1A83D4|nr:HWE histidine kinase domain-containing protein [Aurantimonas sp. HBX-1]UIJ71797.1 PAS domain S-box protein [Aurantimonas sp. HBX-1]